jgi:PST family polysaccharide transporter
MVEPLPKGGLKENIVWLTALQALNYLLPLAIVPYLIRVLGPSSYGILAFAVTFTQYLVFLADYGFNLSATREVAVQRENRERLEEFVSGVFTIKAALLIVAAAILAIFLVAAPKYSTYFPALVVAFLSVAGTVAFPVWLFQGLQDMRLISILSAAGKLICTAAIFFTVHSSNDVLVAVLWTVAGYPIAGMLAWFVMFHRYKIRLHIPSIATLKYALRSGFHIFISSMMITTLTSGAVLMMGFLAPVSAVGIYAAIEKIAKAATMGFSPLTQALYPRTAEHFSEGHAVGRRFVVHSGIYLVTLAFLASVLLASFAKWVIYLICGPSYIQYDAVLRVLSVWVFFGATNNVLGIQYLLGSGRDRAYSVCFTIAAAGTVLLLFLLVPSYLYMGAAGAMTLGEAALTLLMVVTIMMEKRKDQSQISHI